tara:strand:- start:281 stop:547 length:267 start_codon:yes stop_codon:yes gene_type:complete
MARNNYAIFKGFGKNSENLKFIGVVSPTTNSFVGAFNVIKKGNYGYIRGPLNSDKFTHITGKPMKKLPKGRYMVLNNNKSTIKFFTIR